MSTSRSTGSGTYVPPAVLLPLPETDWPVPARLGRAGDWYGVIAPYVAGLVARYSQAHDVVTDLDDHPLIGRAARYLDRRPRTLPDPNQPVRQRRSADVGVLFAALPRPADTEPDPAGDTDGLVEAMAVWRGLLRPGGHLVTVLTPPAVQVGQGSYRSAVIAAARTAGLSWRQELLVVLAPLPEYEPRAMPTPTTVAPALVDGRHAVNHRKLLVFRRPTGGDHA
jgi:hypothetical protein